MMNNEITGGSLYPDIQFGQFRFLNVLYRVIQTKLLQEPVFAHCGGGELKKSPCMSYHLRLSGVTFQTGCGWHKVLATDLGLLCSFVLCSENCAFVSLTDFVEIYNAPASCTGRCRSCRLGSKKLWYLVCSAHQL